MAARGAGIVPCDKSRLRKSTQRQLWLLCLSVIHPLNGLISVRILTCLLGICKKELVVKKSEELPKDTAIN